MLTRCTQSYGGTAVLPGAPALRFVRNGVFVPMGDASGAPGLFEASGALVAEAGFVRGIPEPGLVGQQAFTPLDLEAVSQVADGRPHIYVGQVHHHFGHFLISCFSRLWALRQMDYQLQGCRVLYTNQEPIAECFRHEHVRVLFGALGLREEDFVRYTEPTVIPDAMVPGAAFIENHCVWEEFAGFCNAIGRQVGGAAAPVPRGMVYLTKELVPSGVSHLVNEGDLTAALAARGVAVVAPERLGFAEQIALFRDHRVVAGLISSAFHTSVFAPPGRLLMLNYSPVVWSNQLLIDGCNANGSAYVHAGADFVQEAGDGRFANRFRLLQPERTAGRLLQAMEVLMQAERPVAGAGGAYGSADMRRRATRPLGRNLSRGRPARQSSHSAWSLRASAAEDAAGAVSGVLTGGYQFHTAEEDDAWWDVDLGAPCRVTGVVVYNRLDVGAERSSNLQILLSDDGVAWTELARRVGGGAFGGRTGEPLCLMGEVASRARFVRVQLIGRNYLHLDQVEVFGLPVEALDAVLD